MSRVFRIFAYIHYPYCQYCGRRLCYVKRCSRIIYRERKDIATCDHFIPKSKGGNGSWENKVICCLECNQRKSDKIWERPKGPCWREMKSVVAKRTYKEMLPIALKLNEDLDNASTEENS